MDLSDFLQAVIAWMQRELDADPRLADELRYALLEPGDRTEGWGGLDNFDGMAVHIEIARPPAND